jgi:hypothetical protein
MPLILYAKFISFTKEKYIYLDSCRTHIRYVKVLQLIDSLKFKEVFYQHFRFYFFQELRLAKRWKIIYVRP